MAVRKTMKKQATPVPVPEKGGKTTEAPPDAARAQPVVRREAIETKAGDTKAIETKKDTTKGIETRAAVLKEPEPAKRGPYKARSPRAAAKSTGSKATGKAAVKRSSSKREIKTELFLQFSGKEYTQKDILQKVKAVWTKGLRNKVGDMKEVKIYLKPEEAAAYYVINGDTTGKVDL